MEKLLALSLVILWLQLARGTSADSVTQTEGVVTLPETASLTLKCTYQSNYSVSLFWKGTEAQGKARAVLALLGMSPTGFGSPVVNVLISAAPPDKPPVLTEKSRHNYKNAEFNSYNNFNIPGGCSPHPYLTGGMSEHPSEGSVMAQKVTQNRSEISVLEKEDVTLNCAYEANSYTYYLFWYKQPPSREMIFLIHQESYNELNTTKGLRGEDRVEQSPQTLGIQEGDSLSLDCSYTVNGFRGLQWYRQDPGKGPELLFLLYSVGDEKQEERLRATLLKKGSSLHFKAPKPEDSATYLCAVQTQCSPGTCRLYPNPEAAALE
ncbi:hypothetical protein MJG53_007939 [Ovis ammon polii x Ovis aries]|uniref:Uncharacterized protein n=1 Tax=Ovis ammon polii x Ovis aries TaxID=2918886 RepID=A0ACB9UZT5_9CETA|nr:hypothetical protein MJG53_007939 [Ovis ammon polii x Ovis aries]